MTMPPSLSATSGLNAIAHAVEALYARDRNPIISLMAEEGIRSLARRAAEDQRRRQRRRARTDALYGAWLCGCCLGAVGMALHHKLCHTLGGAFNLPHAETHAVMLPHAAAYNASAEPQAMARIARALGAGRCGGRAVRTRREHRRAAFAARKSACGKRTSIVRPISPCTIPTGIRASTRASGDRAACADAVDDIRCRPRSSVAICHTQKRNEST